MRLVLLSMLLCGILLFGCCGATASSTAAGRCYAAADKCSIPAKRDAYNAACSQLEYALGANAAQLDRYVQTIERGCPS